MLHKLNGYDPWFGVLLSLTVNFVMMAYFCGRLTAQVDAIAQIVADGKHARIELTDKVNTIDKTVHGLKSYWPARPSTKRRY